MLIIALASGCDKISELADDVKDSVQKNVQQTVANRVEDVKQTAGTAGDIELQLDQPVKIPSCYATLFRLAGRSPLVQIASYNDGSNESFPSLFLSGKTTQSEPETLGGATIAVEVYIQLIPDGPVWHTTAEGPATLSISDATGGKISATIQGQLLNTESGASQALHGKLNGSLSIAP